MIQTLIVLLIFISSFVGAQDNTEKLITTSPFNWLVSVDDKMYSNQNINDLLKNGITIKNKIKCKLVFNSEWDTKSPLKKDLGDIYYERMWLECYVGEVEISPDAVCCTRYTKNNNYSSKRDSLGIKIGSSKIMIDCGSPLK